MIFSSYDKNLIEKILPLYCRSYFKEHGWLEIGQMESKASLWQKDLDNKSVKVLIPIDTNLHDYNSRMVELLEILQEIENRPLESIIMDLLNTNSDTLRITAFKGEPHMSLPLINASKLLKRSVNRAFICT